MTPDGCAPACGRISRSGPRGSKRRWRWRRRPLRCCCKVTPSRWCPAPSPVCPRTPCLSSPRRGRCRTSRSRAACASCTASTKRRPGGRWRGCQRRGSESRRRYRHLAIAAPLATASSAWRCSTGRLCAPRPLAAAGRRAACWRGWQAPSEASLGPPSIGRGGAGRSPPSQARWVRACPHVGGAMVAAVCNVNDMLDGHVSLDLECLDRIYLNAYVPNLQVGGQVVGFLTQHLGNPIPSPATFAKLGNAFRAAVERFAATHQIPVIRFAKDARKADVMRPYLEAATEPGVVAIGVAQEFQNVFCGWKRKTTTPGAVSFAFAKADRRVSVYYFYVLDRDFGPGFIKLCSYFPYPAKVWVNGHEWAKRQATREGLAFTELANGFASCDDPAALQAICDRLGPADIQRFFDRWLARIPTPLGLADQAAGYWWELSMRQIEVSRTLV